MPQGSPPGPSTHEEAAAWLRAYAADLEAFAALASLPAGWREQLATLAREVRAAADAPDE